MRMIVFPSLYVKRTLLLVLIALVGIISCQESKSTVQTNERPFIKGVYGNPGSLLEAGYAFDELGLNAIFVRSISLNDNLYETANKQNAAVFVEFPTLNGRNYVEEHPEAWPIDKTGNPAPPADWFMGVCPTDPDFKEYRSNQLRNILSNYEVGGIFLDYVHWHAQFETADPILPETCFCDRCTRTFADHYNLNIPESDIATRADWILENADPSWREWRNIVLNEWMIDMKTIVKEKQPDALVGIFYCSWFPEDHDGALYNTLGIDVEAFAEIADVLSPMMFHKMKEREPEWVSDYTTWLGERIESAVEEKPLVWPIVQAHDSPVEVSPVEFRQVMIEGSKPPSTGIMMFSDRSLLDNREKIDVMREYYHSLDED
ncbi:putative glycoside hydrolase family 15 protein [Rhodohalobacter sulfatireducens]|uniref:Glycoside hydrolase family 15 protein n=1 Tax=Rhodohalobacter sulfatireducens TaxID=2911366 RepID=A0ABS9KDY4_9BACT|nr:putative glycoside hydrolase family 15 protein [Rhodohalobacter sulfatireducens]MCG2589074.1 putative glycoside hydrolase family 15 protein [Rhodohalobacter sulfatireducens]